MAIATDTPALDHLVIMASTLAQGVDRGAVLQASRMTPHGLLQWQITVRPDGQRLLDGCLPTLIQWGDVHPTDAMPHCGTTLQGLRLQHPQDDTLRHGLHAIGLTTIAITNGPALLSATLQTPKGTIEIHT